MHNIRLIVVLTTLTFSAAGYAQDAANEQLIEEVVVVGTQIKGADIAGSLPVSVFDEDDIAATGAASGGELLRSIPQMGFVGFNESVTTGVNAARGDVNSINLRGLGTGNTLTLINGRRMVLHPGTQTENRIPVVTFNSNTLPITGLQRVEVLRDGAAALYGTDAVAGVVNYVLKDDYEGTEFNFRYGTSQGTDLDEVSFNGATGFSFNGGATRVLLSGAYYEKSGFDAAERSYSRSSDLRGQFAGDPLFAGDASLDNRSGLFLGWPEVIFDGGVGRSHLRPTDLERDNGAILSAAQCSYLLRDGLCIDPGGSDRATRTDRNRARQLSPDSDRLNLFSYITHDFDNGYGWYTELGYYNAEIDRTREQAGLLSNGRFTVPADYYWNPLGPVVFDDGRVNPNRVAAAGDPDVPNEGLSFIIRNYTPLDTGLRQVNVEDESFRFVTGVEGSVGEWDFDTGFVYSKAETVDQTNNRISHTLFQQALLSDQADAYNLFNGLSLVDPTSPFDPTPNAQSSIDPFLISVKRQSETSLTLFDFKVSNASLFEMPAGDVGIAAGIEWRKEDFDENRDPRSDGTISFTDLVTGEFLNGSDIVGSSASPDADGSRRITSLFAEFWVPIFRDQPLAESLDLQVAVRHEDFSDVGSITRPKFVLSWYPARWLQVRAAYSEGFRAPNLTQTNIPAVTVVNTVNDPVTGASVGVEERRQGNENLAPEESDNFTYGIVITPTDNLTFTLDYWQIDQEGVVGLLNADNAVLLDSILRTQGSSFDRLIRDPITNEPVVFNDAFQNQELREVAGADFSLVYNLYNDAGSFDFKLNGAYLSKFDQTPGAEQQQIISAGLAPNGVGSLLKENGRPRWRGTASVLWRNDRWGAGLFANWVDDVVDTSTRADGNTAAPGTPLPIDDYLSVSAFVDYDLDLSFTDSTRLRLGIRNLFDEEAPIADEQLGYFGSLHSNRGRYFYFDVRVAL